MRKSLAIFATAITLIAQMASALPRKSVEFTVSGYTGSAKLKNFPVLVRISPERISGFSYAGLALSWMDGATDLAGAPRIAGSRPAMGCFESVYSGATMLFMR